MADSAEDMEKLLNRPPPNAWVRNQHILDGWVAKPMVPNMVSVFTCKTYISLQLYIVNFNAVKWLVQCA